MNEPWFLLFSGTSVDGRGHPKYFGRTDDPKAAHRFLIEEGSDSPYSLSCVQIITNSHMSIVREADKFYKTLSTIGSL